MYQTILIEKADTNQIFAGGFSGGARVASMLALSPSGVKGLVVLWSWNSCRFMDRRSASYRDRNSWESRHELDGDYKFQDTGSKDDESLSNYSLFWGACMAPTFSDENAFIAFSSIAQRDRFSPVNIPLLEAGLAHLKHQLIGLSTIEKVELYRNMVKNFQGMMDIRRSEAELQRLMNLWSTKKPLFVENEFKQIEVNNCMIF